MAGGEEGDSHARRPKTKGKRARAWQLLFLSCFLCCAANRSEDNVEVGQGTHQKTHNVPNGSDNPQNLTDKDIKKRVKQGQARRKKQGKAWYSCFLRKTTPAPQPNKSTKQTAVSRTNRPTLPDKSTTETAVSQNNEQPERTIQETGVPQNNKLAKPEKSTNGTVVAQPSTCTQSDKSTKETTVPHTSESTQTDISNRESTGPHTNKCTTITTIAQEGLRLAKADKVTERQRRIPRTLYGPQELFQINVMLIPLPPRPEDIMRVVTFQGLIQERKMITDTARQPRDRALEWHPVRDELRTEQLEKAAEKNMQVEMQTKKTRWLSFLKGRSFSLKMAITNILMVCTIFIFAWFCATGLNITGEMHHTLD